MMSPTTIVDDIVIAALRGWTPDDLFHILGPAIHPLAHRAAIRVPARVASPYLHAAWLRLLPPADPFYDVGLLPSWHAELTSLKVLRDVELLTPPTTPESDPAAKIRRKIEALLRKAESTEFEEEADALIARAQSLRQSHRLTEALQDPHAAPITRRVYLDAPYVKHKFSLLAAVCYANGVTGVLIDSRGLVSLIGTAGDLDHVIDLHASLARQCEHFLTSSPGAAEAKRTRTTAAYRRSFRLSYATRIGDLLQEANSYDSTSGSAVSCEDAPSSSTDLATVASQALPVLARRLTAAEETRDRLFPHLSTLSLSATHLDGLHDGIAAAESARLGGDSAGLDARQRALTA